MGRRRVSCRRQPKLHTDEPFAKSVARRVAWQPSSKLSLRSDVPVTIVVSGAALALWALEMLSEQGATVQKSLDSSSCTARGHVDGRGVAPGGKITANRQYSLMHGSPDLSETSKG